MPVNIVVSSDAESLETVKMHSCSTLDLPYSVAECLFSASSLFRPLAVFPILAAEKAFDISIDILVRQSGPIQ